MGGVTSNISNYYYYQQEPKGYKLYIYNYQEKSFKLNRIQINIQQWIDALQSPEEKELNQLVQRLKKQILSCHPNKNLDKMQEKLNDLQKIDWKELEELIIHQCKVSNSAAKLLANKKWPKLKKLILRDSKIQNLGLISLLKMQNQELQELQLADNQTTHFALQEIKGVPVNCGFQKLLFLNLDRNKIGANGAKLLSKIYMPQLQRIYCGFGEIQNQGTKHLVKANWPKLQRLSVDYSFIGLQGHEKISLNNWKELKFIWIGENNMSIFGFSQVVTANWNKLNYNSIAGYRNRCSQQMGNILSEIVLNRFNVPINNQNFGFFNQQFNPYQNDQGSDQGQEQNQNQDQGQNQLDENQMNDN